MVKCVVCRTREAEQEHHVSYSPEYKIHVCSHCHSTIHGQGTGPVRSVKNPDAIAIRGLSHELWRVIKIRALTDNKTLGEVATEAFLLWINQPF